MKTRFIVGIIIFLAQDMLGQDPHFSQFFTSPLTLNPASTGNFDGRIRVAGNYRNQWPAMGNAFTTSTLSVDGRFKAKWLPQKDQLSWGLLFLGDQSGDRLFTHNYFGTSISYGKSLDEQGNHVLMAGFQGIYSNFRFDASRANFEDELSPLGFTLPSADAVLAAKPSRNYLDLNAGILYQAAFSEKSLFYFGGSIYHLNRPKLYFANPGADIRERYTIHSGFYADLSESLTLHGSLQWQQQFKNTEWIGGGAISKLLIDRSTNYLELYIGLWVRNRDALIPYVGLDWQSVRAGISYDVNSSKERLSPVRYQSMEFSLIWKLQDPLLKGTLKCPKF